MFFCQFTSLFKAAVDLSFVATRRVTGVAVLELIGTSASPYISREYSSPHPESGPDERFPALSHLVPHPDKAINS